MLAADPRTIDLREALAFGGREMLSDEHRAAVDALRERFEHGVTFVEYGDGTCGTHALKLWQSRIYRVIATEHDDVFAGPDFLGWLSRQLEELQQPEDGCLVLYFDDDNATHAGRVMSAANRGIRSKWGEFPVYDHPLFEVTVSYGDVARFYGAGTREDVIELFTEYAREKLGGEVVDDAIGGILDAYGWGA